jgi:prepilin-type N-terminal cleavage/methylation domain-containing protein
MSSARPIPRAVAREPVGRNRGFTLLEVMVAFSILAIVMTALSKVHVDAVKKGGLAVDYREAREGADTVFRRITYEIDKPDWPDGKVFTFDIEYGEYVGLPTHERDRWRAFRGVLRKQRRMAAGSDPTGVTPSALGDETGQSDRERREAERREAERRTDAPDTGGEEVYLVRLEVYLGEESDQTTPFLTLSTFVPVPESERRVAPPTSGMR